MFMHRYFSSFECGFPIAKKILLAATIGFAAVPGVSQAQTWTHVGATDFSPHEADFESIAIAPNGTPYVVYDDFLTNKPVVKKFDGTSWVLVGTGGVDSFTAGSTVIKVDKNGTPYVGFTSGDDSAKEIVMKYDGISWTVVGSPDGFTAGPASSGRLVLDSAGMPYVAYLEDSGCFVLPSMMKFNGTSWVHVGTNRFTIGTADFMDMAIWGTTPYFAYPDQNDSGKLSVVRFNGSAWETVGAEGFSASDISSVSIAFSNGTPYVAFGDMAHAMKATVMKFDGTNWVNVGVPDFTRGGAENLTLAIDKNGTPYVGYTDDSISGFPATVMKFNGTNWEAVGTPGCTGTFAEYPELAIDTFGTPYLVYQDLIGGREVSVIKYESTTAISSVNPLADDLSIFPNPNQGSFTINFNASVQEAHLAISNMLGEKVEEMAITTNKETEVLLNNAPGIYFVTVEAAGQRTTRKIVVQ